MQLTQEDARAVHLAAQGIIGPVQAEPTRGAVLDAIRRLGALQIDSISVVARSPYLVLWSRLGTYDPRWLDELLARGRLFEYWSHAACFLPREDWPLYRRDMLELHPRSRAWLAANEGVRKRVLSRLQDAGPVRSSEWERAGGVKGGGWWDWKPEKIALEALFATGEVMVTRRENFQRVYDLRERVLPHWDDTSLPSHDWVRREFALKAVRALGVAKAQWVPDYFKRPVKGTSAVLERLADEGQLARVAVEAWNQPGYIHPDNLRFARAATRGILRHRGTTLLSPFDPVVWDRARLLDLWAFHYRIEVYTPAPKRRYGYYTLPILHHGQLIGRLDPKAHRAAGTLEIRRIHLEPGVAVTPTVVQGLADTLLAFARWQNLTVVQVGSSDPSELAAHVRAHMEEAAPSSESIEVST